MAVYIYNDGDHPANFIGVRVARSIAGKLYQKYFSFRKSKNINEFISLTQQNKFINKAISIDKQLKAQQVEAKKAAKLIADHSPHAREEGTTGISGIMMKIAVDRKERYKGYEYYRVGFCVSRGHGKSDKLFSISYYGYEQAWREAVLFWLNHHELGEQHLDDLLIKMPKPNRFKILLKQMNVEGWDIPVSALNHIFTGRKQIKIKVKL